MSSSGRCSVFDEYRSAELGEGKRSLAFRVAFQSSERTLSDEDAQALRARIVEALADPLRRRPQGLNGHVWGQTPDMAG